MKLPFPQKSHRLSLRGVQLPTIPAWSAASVPATRHGKIRCVRRAASVPATRHDQVQVYPSVAATYMRYWGSWWSGFGQRIDNASTRHICPRIGTTICGADLSGSSFQY
jgi:hypothetical protein